MAVFAVVPVKELNAAKLRLSLVLNPHERKMLTLAMLEDVLKTLKSSMVDKIVVVSNDMSIHQTAAKLGVSRISTSQPGLNPAVEEATAWCMQNEACALLILPADTPLISSKDMNSIIALGSDGASLVLSPSPRGGTNVLFQNPPNLIRARFGPQSFMKHVDEGRRTGAKIRFYYSVGTGLDIDSAEDLEKLLEIENNTLCRRVLEKMGKITR